MWYRVRAIVEHIGDTSEAGHYRTWIRTEGGGPLASDRRTTWTLYDDRTVRTGQHELPAEVETGACLLFYESLCSLASTAEESNAGGEKPASEDEGAAATYATDEEGDVVMEDML